MIYIIQLETTSYIKIGFCRTEDSFQKRLKAYYTSSPFNVIILLKIEGDLKTESIIHNMFKENYVKGEWFTDCEKIRNFINNPIIIEPEDVLHRIANYLKLPTSKIIEEYKNGSTCVELGKKYNCTNGTILRRLPKELRRNRSEVQINRRDFGNDNYNRKPILQLDKSNNIIKEFKSLAEAGIAMNGDSSFIGKATRKQRTAYGYKWRYKHGTF